MDEKLNNNQTKVDLASQAMSDLQCSLAENHLDSPVGTETDWGVVGEPNYRFTDDPTIPKGPLHHTRSMPLPLRVKLGEFRDDCLYVETANEELLLPWCKIKFASLGIINEKSETEATAYQFEKMMGGVGRMMKASTPEDGKIITYRETNLFDIYCEDMKDPVRFDASMVNYRGFLLHNISFVSFQNYFKLVHSICSRIPSAYVTPNVQNFLQWKRESLQKFQSLDDYEDDCLMRLNRLNEQIPHSSLDFSRKSWAEEWADD